MIRIDLLLPALLASAALNLVALALFGADKQRARRHSRRISERTLLLAALAGPFGALAGMRVFRHKTRKLRFVVAVPCFTTFHAALIIALSGTGFGA
jgi:uncharacterized membrane protein YsdA (DUF1294 family)